MASAEYNHHVDSIPTTFYHITETLLALHNHYTTLCRQCALTIIALLDDSEDSTLPLRCERRSSSRLYTGPQTRPCPMRGNGEGTKGSKGC
jgi:hypothetical protein